MPPAPELSDSDSEEFAPSLVSSTLGLNHENLGLEDLLDHIKPGISGVCALTWFYFRRARASA